MPGKEFLRMEHIRKVYSNGVVANSDITFAVDHGEIHALSGENGAGKTTLMKMLFGEEQPTRGDIYINGEKTVIASSAAAIRLGIGMVHQHFMLVPSLTVVENMILGMEPKKGLVIDQKLAERLAEQGIYPEGFGKDAYEDMKQWEKTVRPDMLFCGAPHILIPHAPMGKGEPVQDVIIAGTYFELMCASRGLGTVMMTFPLSVLNLMPKIRGMLEIPEDHYVGMIIGFGYPQIPYARGTQRTVEPERIHRLSF